MGTDIRSEISTRSKHWIPKERYLELRHFCLQVPMWVNELKSCHAYMENCEHVSLENKNIGRRTEDVALRISLLENRIDMVKKCAKDCDPSIGSYVLTAVINGKTYTNLKAMYNIPCGRDMFYSAYRKFFWLLDKERG